MKKTVFFKNLFYAYTLVVVIYVLISSSIYFYNQKVFTKKSIQEQNKVFVEQVADKIDMKIGIAFNLIEQLKTNTDVIEYASNGRKNYYNILKIHNQLKNHLDAFSQFGYSIGIGKVGDEMLIESQYTIRMKDYLPGHGFYSINKDHIDATILNNPRNYLLYSTDHETRRSNENLLYITEEKVGKKDSPILFFLSFSKDKLVPPIQNKLEDTFFLLNKDNEIILSQNQGISAIEEGLGPEILDQLYQLSTQEGYHMLKSDQHYLYIVTSDNKRMPFTSVYMTPKSIVAGNRKELAVTTLVIGLVLLTVGMLLSFLISKKIYSPVGRILTSFEKYIPEYKKDIGNQKDEFTYIQQTVDTMNERNIKLQGIIKESQESLKIKFLRDLIADIPSKKTIQESIEQYHLGYLASHSRIVILQYVIDEEFKKELSEEAFVAIKKEIINWFDKHIKEKMQVELFELDYKRCVLILGDQDIPKIKKELNELILEVEEIFGVNMIASLGKEVKSLGNIHDSFTDAVSLLEYQLIWRNRLIITNDDVGELKEDMYYYPLEIEKVLIGHVLKGRKSEVDKLLDRVLEKNLQNTNLGPDALSQFIFAIVGTSHRILHQMVSLDQETLEERKIHYVALKMSNSKEDLGDKIRTLFEQLTVDCMEEIEKREDGMVDGILDFIHDNYNIDLSLTDIAEQFNLSAGYVGILFKTTTGENFKEYLSMYKVKKAKEILENEEIKIKDLATRVGCNTTNTFIRMFKKYVGVSPGQYRDELNI